MSEAIIPSTYDRVRAHTAGKVNERLDQKTARTLEACRREGPQALTQRLRQLDREWDIDRVVMAMFVTIAGTVFQLGTHVHRGWLILFQLQMLSMLSHATVGWCPPTPVLRRLGFRTQKEISAERQAIWAMLEQQTPATSAALA